MEYLLLIHSDPALVPNPAEAPEDFQSYMAAWLNYNARLIDGGHFIAGASLAPPLTASVVDTSTTDVTDGPFIEAKEQVGGFYLITADNLDVALELARAIPTPAKVEVRPVAFRPTA
jgi:hypothetical protein